MAKDYFQDILPPAEQNPPRSVPDAPEPRRSAPAPAEVPASDDSHPVTINTNPVRQAPAEGERSIRNISMPQRPRGRPAMNDMREYGDGQGMPPRRNMLRGWWLWILAAGCVIVLGVLLLVAMRSTTVTVTPRSQTTLFDQSTPFTAYPAETATSGTLSYTVQTVDLADSEVIASKGTVHSEDKASGTITVYNNYQTSSFKLIKNTRFQSAGGLIFRTPADIVIPGKKGTTPGQVSVTVVADQPGEQYNVAAGKFTVPGLKSSAAIYPNIYAQSTAAMTGGFVGDKPGVEPAAMQAAVGAVRARLESKARESIDSTGGTVVFPDLVQITYKDEPTTAEAGGGVRIHESAHVVIPVFPADAFAQTVYADVNGASVAFTPGNGFAARLVNASSTLGNDPIQFTLAGSAQLVWNIDSAALQQALAGKEQSAFEAIVTQFLGVQEAHARIQPFWKSTFPTDSAAIKIDVLAPKAQ